MPELPEVETARRVIEAQAINQTIARVEVRNEKVLEVSPQKLWGNLTDRTFEAAERHGKYIFVKLENGRWLVLHLGMTGVIENYDAPENAPDHARVIIHFASGTHLAFDNQRMFGEVAIVDAKDSFIQEKALGPDAFSITKDLFRKRLSNRRGMIKSMLMDQQVLAGIGNVYSDEILFQVRIHPHSKVNNIAETEHLDALYDQMESVLETAVNCRVKQKPLPQHFFIPHRREGANCPHCDGKIERITTSGRNGYFCPSCQKEIS